jgi:hypothetical protein
MFSRPLPLPILRRSLRHTHDNSVVIVLFANRLKAIYEDGTDESLLLPYRVSVGLNRL